MAVARLWSWYLGLLQEREWLPARDGAQPLPLRSRDIAAWAGLHRVVLAPWQLQALRALDDAWLLSRTHAPEPPTLADGSLDRAAVQATLQSAFAALKRK